MAPKNPFRPFTPDPEQMALAPPVSGNAINGLGERGKRRPRPVYWRDPDTLAHGAMQRWFYTNDPDNPDIGKAREARARIMERELLPLAPDPAVRSAGEWTRALLEFANDVELELIGITEIRDEWVFEDSTVDKRWAVMIGVAHDYQEIRHAPAARAGAEVVRQYGRGLNAALDIADWFRQQGHDAIPQAGPLAGSLLMIPPAVACGFGELGRHGSIINRDYGSSFRIAAVLTDTPLEPTKPMELDVDDFCTRCQVCSNACPPDAILPEKKWVRGDLKWYVDFDKCLPFFNQTFGCGICIAVCPWSIPGRGPRIVEQLRRRRERQQAGDSGS